LDLGNNNCDRFRQYIAWWSKFCELWIHQGRWTWSWDYWHFLFLSALFSLQLMPRETLETLTFLYVCSLHYIHSINLVCKWVCSKFGTNVVNLWWYNCRFWLHFSLDLLCSWSTWPRFPS